MSEHDDTLLDEDLGDEEYDLGNDEEEALLADDYELERQNSYKGEEETDDVLDLGVTDALDDLDGEDENIEFSRSDNDKNNDNDFYEDADQLEARSKYYEQEDRSDYRSEQARPYEDHSANDSVNMSSNINKGDLREKLQKNAKIYAGNGQGLEDDECEEARERRNRFQNERTIVSPKMNNNIPDTLESVVTPEPTKSFRGRGRGRCTRGGSRGGRFITQNTGNFNPRFSNMRNPNFDSQPPACTRPPLLETRPPFLLGVPNNMQNQQIIYQQSNPQMPPFRHYSPNGPHQGPTHFLDSRSQFNTNQFQGQVGPRVMGPRHDYGPRANLPGSVQGPSYPCPPNQSPYVQIQQGPFQNSAVLMQDNPPRNPPLIQSNQGPLLQGNPGGPIHGNPNPLVAAAPALLQGSQPLQGPMQGFRQQSTSQSHVHQNVQIPNQAPFENRPPTSFQDAQFENRPVYDSRSGYPDQGPAGQFNNNAMSASQQSSNVPNLPLPPGHKILINPHFRGAVQPTSDARLVWDSAQQAPSSQISGGGQFSQSSPYQNQPPYNQAQQPPPHYQQNYHQNKSDDPYAYFSDVWQENKPQKTQGGSPTKQYASESNYERDNYDSGSKYKSESQWDQKNNYQEDHRGGHQSYRDRDLPPKGRSDYAPKSRTMSNTYRDDYDQNHSEKSPGSRPANSFFRPRLLQKRVTDVDRPLRDLSPKRMKSANRNLQEVRTVSLSDVHEEKKEEDNDPEMQEYRKKMEEQKRLREKILREKENRRKMAAMEKQSDNNVKNESNSSNDDTQQDTKPVSLLMGVVKEATNKSQPGTRGRGRPVGAQTTEAVEKVGVRFVRTIQTVPTNDSIDSTKDTNLVVQPTLGSQSGIRRVVIQKPLTNSQKIATSIQKTVSNLQKGQLTKNQIGMKKVVTQRIVTQKLTGNLPKNTINVQEANAQKVVVNTQNNQRVVLHKQPLPKKPEIKTNTVKLENLAASTSETQIRRMCQGIGTIESIQMGERSATIVFKTQSAATVFHKKYQRKMLDLSLITVRLVPQSAGTKTTTAIVKVS